VSAIRGLCVIETVGLGGGAERLVVSLLPALRERGILLEVVELFGWDKDIGYELEEQGFLIHRLNLPGRWALHRALPRLARLARERSPDFLWGHLFFGNLYAMLTARRAGVPSIITLHNAFRVQEPVPGLRSKANLATERILGRFLASKRVGVSRAVADAYREAFGWDDVAVVPCGIPMLELEKDARRSVEKRAETRSRLGISGISPVLAVPSRFVPVKGHTYLLHALKILKERSALEPTLLAPGEGPTLPQLKREAEELGIAGQVRFLPLLPRAELFEVLAASDAVVLPSLSEAFGIAAAEAMAFGKPLILSRVPGLLELAGDPPCALMAAPASAEDIAGAIEKVFRDPSLAADLAEKGRKRAARFDISLCADRWAELFRATATGHQAPRKPPRAYEASP
jgi:glycosyltransferase involved in cell wall biosynthesis